MIFDPFIKKNYFALHRHLFRFTALLLGIIKFIYFLRICRTFCPFLKCFFEMFWFLTEMTGLVSNLGTYYPGSTYKIFIPFSPEPFQRRKGAYIHTTQTRQLYIWMGLWSSVSPFWLETFFFFFFFIFLYCILYSGTALVP